jgi:hypothetical protein
MTAAAAALVCLLASCANGPVTERSSSAAAATTTVDPDLLCDGAEGTGQIETAGNETIWFLGDVQSGRDSEHVTPKGDWFGCGYERLCAAVRSRVDEASFRASRGEAVSPLLTADAFSGSRSDRGEFRVGIDQEHDDIATVDPQVTSTWVDVDATWDEHDGASIDGTQHIERWRVLLVRESGGWKVCGAVKVG